MSLDRVVWIDRGWQPVDLGFCPSKRAWKHAARRYNIKARWPNIPPGGGHAEWFKNETTGLAIILVAVNPKPDGDALTVLLTLVHEAVHVWQFLCKHIGEKAPGIEMEAYGIEAISRGLIDAYCRTLGKGKNWPV